MIKLGRVKHKQHKNLTPEAFKIDAQEWCSQIETFINDTFKLSDSQNTVCRCVKRSSIGACAEAGLMKNSGGTEILWRDFMITIRKYRDTDLENMISIWNDVVEEGIAFPQEEQLSYEDGLHFFNSQTFCGVAIDISTDRVVGLYILHPNNVGRCGHLCNASYAVDKQVRGQHIGEKLVKHCIQQAAKEGFRVLQFNAVVKTNTAARHLYERCGFTPLGIIPKGFRMKDGHYEDICPYYIEVVQ